MSFDLELVNNGVKSDQSAVMEWLGSLSEIQDDGLEEDFDQL